MIKFKTCIESQLTNFNNKMFKKETKRCYVCFFYVLSADWLIDSWRRQKNVGTLNDCWTFQRTLWPFGLDRLLHKNISAQIRFSQTWPRFNCCWHYRQKIHENKIQIQGLFATALPNMESSKKYIRRACFCEQKWGFSEQKAKQNCFCVQKP